MNKFKRIGKIIRSHLLIRLRITVSFLILLIIILSLIVTFKATNKRILRFYKDKGNASIEHMVITIIEKLNSFTYDPAGNKLDLLNDLSFKQEILYEFTRASMMEDISGTALLDINYKTVLKNGDIIFGNNPSEIQNHQYINGKQVSYDGKNYFLFLTPIEIIKESAVEGPFLLEEMENFNKEKEIIGYILMNVSLEEFDKQVEQWAVWLGFTGFLLLLLSIVVQNIIFKKFMKPFEDIVQATSILGSGDYSFRLNSKRDDEFGKLSQSFDQMANDLEKNINELADKHKQLQKAYKELEVSKEMIIRQEKLVSLGTMVAGIAHEINNPAQAIKFSTESLKLDILDIKAMIGQLNSIIHSKLDDLEEYKNQLSTTLQKADINFLLDEIEEIITENDQSLQRIENIVKSTKRMAYSDLQLTTCDINEIINDAITLALNQIKYDLSIEFDGGQSIPTFLGSPQELGQIFINLIINAKDAVKKKGVPKSEAKLIIKTRFDAQKKIISIVFKDNGTGIKPDMVNKIFDPFFTTKPIGQGTGLGLNLSHKIIESHKGTIDVDSEYGQWTRFTITVPINNDLKRPNKN